MNVSITKCVIPETVNVGPLAQNEVLVRLENGTYMIANKDRPELTRRVLPRNFSVKDIFIINHTVDRDAKGLASLHAAQSMGLAWFIHFGFCHDMWNSIRNSAKIPGGGIIWQEILKLVKLVNQNHGPFI